MNNGAFGCHCFFVDASCIKEKYCCPVTRGPGSRGNIVKNKMKKLLQKPGDFAIISLAVADAQ